MDLGARRDGIVPGLQARNGGHDQVERNVPYGSIARRGNGSDIVSSGSLENFSNLEASLADDVCVSLFVGVDFL